VSIGSEIKVCAIHRDKFKELIQFVSPYHCSQAKAFFEKYKIFQQLGKKAFANLIKDIDLVKYRKGTTFKDGEIALMVVAKGVIHRVL
jgi:hypothetical protein